jgi:hypothetical protein
MDDLSAVNGKAESALWSHQTLPRRFQLVRSVDVSGISGVGIVAWGVQFPDGKIVTRWNGEIAQVSVWDQIEDVIAIHGHEGTTVCQWID